MLAVALGNASSPSPPKSTESCSTVRRRAVPPSVKYTSRNDDTPVPASVPPAALLRPPSPPKPTSESRVMNTELLRRVSPSVRPLPPVCAASNPAGCRGVQYTAVTLAS